MLILKLEFLRHFLADDVLVDLLEDFVRDLLQLAVELVHVLPEIFLHHPLQLVHFLIHLPILYVAVLLLPLA